MTSAIRRRQRHQYNLETGRTIGEYDFGEYIPRIVADGYLWLTRIDLDAMTDNGAPAELARLPLG